MCLPLNDTVLLLFAYFTRAMIGKKCNDKKKCHIIYLSHETILFHFVEHFQRKNKHKGFGVIFFAI